jgi:CHAD domain-containing protein
VHQARIALRRLRSALSLFRAVLPLNQVRMFQTRLRALAATLGEARDLDVMSASAEPGPMAQRVWRWLATKLTSGLRAPLPERKRVA